MTKTDDEQLDEGYRLPLKKLYTLLLDTLDSLPIKGGYVDIKGVKMSLEDFNAQRKIIVGQLYAVQIIQEMISLIDDIVQTYYLDFVFIELVEEHEIESIKSDLRDIDKVLCQNDNEDAQLAKVEELKDKYDPQAAINKIIEKINALGEKTNIIVRFPSKDEYRALFSELCSQFSSPSPLDKLIFMTATNYAEHAASYSNDLMEMFEAAHNNKVSMSDVVHMISGRGKNTTLH